MNAKSDTPRTFSGAMSHAELLAECGALHRENAELRAALQKIADDHALLPKGAARVLAAKARAALAKVRP